MLRSLNTVARRASLIAGASLFALTFAAAPAVAQDQPPPAQESLPATEPVGIDSDVIVTGSRLPRSEYDSPDPIQVIDPAMAMKQGKFDTAEMLQSSPIAAGSVQITAAISSNFVTNGGEGSQTISLRGLGAERTLVLLNGRRAGPAGTRGGVSSFDLNVLPSSIVKRVEILKTGASSIYGSDAVAGVVNLFTKTDTNGVQLGGFASVPEKSGGETYSISATYGKEFDRGHFLVTADYYYRGEIAKRDREFLGCTEDYLFDDRGNRIDGFDPIRNRFNCNNTQGPFISIADIFGLATNLDANGVPFSVVQYGTPETLGRFVPRLRAPAPGSSDFGAPATLYPVFYDNQSTALTNQYPQIEEFASVFPETKRLTLYADASFELTPGIELYTELLYNNRKTYTNSIRQIFPLQFTGDTILPAALDFDPDSTGDPINAGFSGDVLIQPVGITDHNDSSADVTYYRGVFGARGSFGGFLSGWNWDAYGQYSRSDGDYWRQHIYQDSVDAATLRTRSCVGTRTAIRNVPCIDINYTDPRVLNGDFTAAEKAFLYGETTGNTLYTQWTGEASLAGNLFSLPAGEVKLAIGGQWRRDEINDVPGEATLAGNVYGTSSSGITAGFSRTSELFGEVEIPLIYNTPLIKELKFSGAARLTNVHAQRKSDGFSDTDNGNWTYKLGLNWQVNDWVRLRGTWGTSYRAPALFEQFLADETSFPSQPEIDPCIRWGQRLGQGLISQRFANNCAADGVPADYVGGPEDATSFASGGIGRLRPETSTAKSASIIFTPQGGLWGGMKFSLAVDYFDIEVRGEITQLGNANIVQGCYDSEFFPNEPLCDLFTRDPASAPNGPQIVSVRDPFINITNQRTRGVDVTAQFQQELGSWGNLGIQAQMTWQFEDKFELFDGNITDDNGEMGDPKWVGDFNVFWQKDDWSLNYGLDVIGGTSDLGDLLEDRGSACFFRAYYNATVCPDVRGEPTFYHSVSLTRSIGDQFDFTLGVSNLLDTNPPRVSTVYANIGVFGQVPTLGTQYDYFGRRLFVNVRAKL